MDREKSIRVTAQNGTGDFQMKGRFISQFDVSGNYKTASANVVDVLQYDLPPFIVTELFVENVDGSFLPNRTVQATLDDGTVLSEKTFGVFNEYTVINSGTGYKIGDFVTLVDEGSGVGAAARVVRVDNKGRIKEIQIINHGVNYFNDSNFTIESRTGDGASGTAVASALAEYDGFYYDDGGKLSSSKNFKTTIITKDFHMF